MKNILLITLAFIALFGCNNNSEPQEDKLLKESQQLKKENELLKKETELTQREDSLNKLVSPKDSVVKVESSDPERITDPEWQAPDEHGTVANLSVRQGSHNFTLQWLGWDKPGKVKIKYDGEGDYTIEGEQRNKDGYVTIEGMFSTASKKELIFTGKIVSQVHHLNNGEPCERDGQYRFISTKKRKYWRLQEMDNCEGGNVVDYIDIYF